MSSTPSSPPRVAYTATPEVQYARNGDYHIAYQVLGDGPIDIVFIAGFISHCEHQWEEPSLARSLRRMASFGRLIWFDKRWTGMSDPVAKNELPTLEQEMEDLRTVLDTVGSKRAALLGFSEAGAMCCLFAATYPERVSALVLYGAWARFFEDDGYPATPRAMFRPIIDNSVRDWGKAVVLPVIAPSMADDPRFRAWWAQWERLSCSPGSAGALLEIAFEADVRHVLSSIQAPTLVITRTGDRLVDPRHSQYLAAQIPGARLVQFPGDDHIHFAGNTDEIMDEIEAFLTGHRRGVESDRVLATILAVDIVRSTEQAAQLGDRRWRDLLDAFTLLVRRQLERFRGTEVERAGDGVLAIFDGPARAIRCALAIRDGVARLGMEVRCGLHCGEIELLDHNAAGTAVHLATSVAKSAAPGEVRVSRTVKDLIAGSGLVLEACGRQHFDGVDDTWQVFRVAAES